MKRSFVLSGHFSSPPERDPWTKLRHDYRPEEAFAPRFTALSRSCYGANSASRILGPDGKVQKIVNNYTRMSFSFAPDLLDELKVAAPNVYRRILDADRDSLQRLGHGNALAQPWSGAILPLLSERQIRYQVQWGLAAFASHFGRSSEGFWLPHQAVSPVVLDVLVEHGVQWILLSGWQAEATMPLEAGSWVALGEQAAPAGQCFRLDRPRGSLGVFFQDEGLLQAMRGGGLLRNAEALDVLVRDKVAGDAFVTVAAPGELFGFEEPFADMCLSALWDKLGVDEPIEVVNYGVLWERHRPTRQVRLKKGQQETGSSGDCPHGVERWKSACGCRAGGTGSEHQRWREPLGVALRRLEARVSSGLDRTLQSLGVQEAVWAERVPQLLSHRQAPRGWAAQLLTTPVAAVSTSEAEDQLLSWTHAYHWAQNALTADLWHFADPFLPEARGGWLAALRCLELIEPEQEGPWFQEFLHSLETEGNHGTTLREQWEAQVLPRRHGFEFPAALFLFDRLLRSQSSLGDALGPFRVRQFTRQRQELPDSGIRLTGVVELLQTELDHGCTLEYLLLDQPGEGVSLTLKRSGESPKPFDLEWLPMGERTEIVRWLGSALEAQLASEAQAIFPLLRKSLVYSRLLDVPPLPMTRSLMEVAVTRKILELADAADLPQPETFVLLDQELGFARDYQLELDRDRLNQRFARWLYQALAKPEEFSSEKVVLAVETLIQLVTGWKFQPDVTVAQSLVYEALQLRGPQLLKRGNSGHVEAWGELRRLLRLGDLLGIDTSELRSQLPV